MPVTVTHDFIVVNLASFSGRINLLSSGKHMRTSQILINSSAVSSSFLTYQNKSNLGIAIKYPFSWRKTAADHNALVFLAPSKKDAFAERLTLVAFGVDKSISVNQLFNAAINNYGQLYSDFYIVDSKLMLCKESLC